jgi:hypothetical protein
VDAEAFLVFERWVSRPRASDVDLDWPLCKFLFLTDYLQALSIQKPLLQALAFKPDKNRVVPLSLIIPVIYENILPSSPLRRLRIGWVVQYATPEGCENDDWVFPEDFLCELAAAQL